MGAHRGRSVTKSEGKQNFPGGRSVRGEDWLQSGSGPIFEAIGMVEAALKKEHPRRERLPAHLRRYVVNQEYSEYNAVDQAVWRFVLLQMSSRLRRTAHPAYSEGLKQTGISVEHIPSI